MITHGESGESSVYMLMNSAFNINLIITREIKVRVLIHTVISAHVWPVDEASSYQTCDYLKVMLILLYAFDRGLSNSIHNRWLLTSIP